jgi:protein SCO1/2
MRLILGPLLAALLVIAACGRPAEPPPRHYELKGQILSIKPEEQEVLVKHEDIPGFMPAMTMPYKVKSGALLEGKQPGDLITATLEVGELEANLTAITKTGSAPISDPAAGPAISAADFVDPGEAVPDRPLVDQDNAARPISSLRGHRVALTFIYTRCPLPDFCPLMDKNFQQVQQAVKNTPALRDVQLLSVTIDPAFDTPAVLKKHAQDLGADPAIWHFVTGSTEQVAAFARSFGVTADPDQGSTALVHNLRTAVIDPEGRLVKAYSGNMWTPAELIADLNAAPAPAH